MHDRTGIPITRWCCSFIIGFHWLPCLSQHIQSLPFPYVSVCSPVSFIDIPAEETFKITWSPLTQGVTLGDYIFVLRLDVPKVRMPDSKLGKFGSQPLTAPPKGLIFFHLSNNQRILAISLGQKRKAVPWELKTDTRPWGRDSSVRYTFYLPTLSLL